MIFGNPVHGEILPFPKNAPAGQFQVTQPFGSGSGIYSGEPRLGGKPFHRGIDLGDERCGSAVLAAAAGRVSYAGRLGNGELVVIVRHAGGWGTSYGHLADREVTRGERVDRGQKIGDVGSSGYAAGCHLHFAMKSGLATFAAIDFIPNPYGGRGDTTGRWRDPWPQLTQNVTVHPKNVEGIRIRNASTVDGDPFATTAGGRIVRFADDVDLGPALEERRWGGQITGGQYVVDGGTSRSWERIWLDGAFRFLATPLAERSAS